MDIDLKVREQNVRTYLELIKDALGARRTETTFDADGSHHRFYTGIGVDDVAAPVIVTISVRKAGQRVRVSLSDIRPLDATELVYMGLTEQPEWTAHFSKEAKVLVLDVLAKTRQQVLSRTDLQQYHRRHLVYRSPSLDSEYWVESWRLGPAADSMPNHFGEHVLLCDRVFSGATEDQIRDSASNSLNELADLLTVFWMKKFDTPKTDFVYVIEPPGREGGSEFTSRRVQTGYIDPSRPEVMPLPGEINQAGDTVDCDRMDPTSHAASAGRPFTPPRDASSLFALYRQADFGTATRFRHAAKAYHLSNSMLEYSETAAIAYLVVAAESLCDVALTRCSECGELRGIFQAAREFFFRELPCLKQEEDFASSLLRRAYDLRSRHFHDAKFASDELRPSSSTEVIAASVFEAATIREDFQALVNSLMVAWLWRTVTGNVWPRALDTPPQRRQRRYFSFTAQL